MKLHHIVEDTLMLFGKYKGQSVNDVLKKDAGYIFWCEEAGVATLSERVKIGIRQWVSLNPTKASAISRSGRKAIAERAMVRIENIPKDLPTEERVEYEAFEPKRPEVWGTW